MTTSHRKRARIRRPDNIQALQLPVNLRHPGQSNNLFRCQTLSRVVKHISILTFRMLQKQHVLWQWTRGC